MRTLVDAKINVTKLPRLEKWDCSNYFLLKGYFHSAVEGGWVARNKTVVTVSQSTSQGTHFAREVTWAMIFLTWQRGAKAGAQAARAVLCVTASFCHSCCYWRERSRFKPASPDTPDPAPSSISWVKHGISGAEEFCGQGMCSGDCCVGAAFPGASCTFPPGCTALSSGYLLRDA